MYIYIYDSFLNDKKYEKSLIQLENAVTDLGINGHIHKLSILKNLKEIIEDEIRSGATTVVVVGNDNTVSQAIDVIAKKNITLGIIPIGPENSIAAVMGINSDNAIEILSKRVIQKLDLGKVNDIYFLSSLQIINTNAIIQSRGYKITPRFSNYTINIYNLLLEDGIPDGYFPPNSFNPIDGMLEAVIHKEEKTSFANRLFGKKKNNESMASFLPFKKLKIKKSLKKEDFDDEKEIKVIVDGQKIIKTPLDISVAPHSLRIIVGKARNFG